MDAERRNRYDLALEAALRAGDLAKSYFDGDFEVEWKADQSPVTIADKKAEELIRKLVAEKFPSDGFLGEEYGDQPGTSGYRWIIDPIDGTKSFVRGIPLWGTLIGLEFQGEQIAGVCRMPMTDTTYHALQGNGAYRDSRRIRVSDVSELKGSLMCYSSIIWFRRHGRQEAFLNLVSATERQRGYGDFYGFMLVAQGSAELMVEHGVHPWDVAAVKPIVEEAGGIFTDWSGTPTIHRPDVIAGNGKVNAVALEMLNR